MARLLQIFGFLSVLFRGGTLSFGSLTIGGIVFLNFVARAANSQSDAVNQACLRWIRCAAVALAVMQMAYILASTLILMQSADMTISDVSGANFVLAGILAIASASTIVLLASAQSPRNHAVMLLPAALILVSSVMTSHAMARLDYRFPLAVVTALHQGATATWLGGLFYLLIAIPRSPDNQFAPTHRSFFKTRIDKRGRPCRGRIHPWNCLRRFARRHLRHFLRHHGCYKGRPLRHPFASRRPEFSDRPLALRWHRDRQPKTLRRSRTRHRHHRDSHRRLANFSSAGNGSKNRPRHHPGNRRSTGTASPTPRQPGHPGPPRRHLRRRSESLRRRHALVRIVCSRSSRNAPQHSCGKILVGVQPSLGGLDRSGYRPPRFSRPNQALPVGPKLAAPLSWSLPVSFLKKRSRDVASRPQRLLGHTPGSGSPASPHLRAARHCPSDLRMACANRPRRHRTRSPDFPRTRCRRQRPAAHPLAQPRQHKRRSSRRTEPRASGGLGSRGRLVALARTSSPLGK